MKITIIDELPPEVCAMAQALQSRSPKSIEEHLNDIEERGHEKFMSRYYVGYGHKSIGDNAYVSVFLEGVSMLAAKYVQSSPLYSGQECSTRYQDFMKLHEEDPCVSARVNRSMSTRKTGALIAEISSIQDSFLAIYEDVTSATKKYFVEKLAGIRDDATALRAAHAAAYDVSGGFLPLSMKTNLSWTTNLRQLHDHIVYHLLPSPYREVSELGIMLYDDLREKYPSSFKSLDMVLHGDIGYEHTRVLSEMATTTDSVSFRRNQNQNESKIYNGVRMSTRAYDVRTASFMTHHLQTHMRGKCEMLSREFEKAGVITFEFNLDFRSFRDLQRHRGSYIPIPGVGNDVLRSSIDLQDNLYIKTVEKALSQVDNGHALLRGIRKEYTRAIDVCREHPYVGMYALPMLTEFPCTITASLPQIVYIIELRLSNSVHPTLRRVAEGMYFHLLDLHPGIHLNARPCGDGFLHLPRGRQTITDLSDQ